MKRHDYDWTHYIRWYDWLWFLLGPMGVFAFLEANFSRERRAWLESREEDE